MGETSHQSLQEGSWVILNRILIFSAATSMIRKFQKRQLFFPGPMYAPMNPYNPASWVVSHIIGLLLFVLSASKLRLFAVAVGAASAGTAAAVTVPAILIYFFIFQPLVNKLLMGVWAP